MPTGFIIMQIGNPDLDSVCEKVIVPALTSCGLEARRVDKHNQGGLLKSEIIKFIETSEIIVADLTNERPNCYLEVGFAMGVDKFRNLILTAREDHNQDHPKHKQSGPKVHFDLAGYDLLFWNPDDLNGFRTDLEKRIRRRQAVLSPQLSQESNASLDTAWFKEHEAKAREGFAKFGKKGCMEVKFSLARIKPTFSQQELIDAARKSAIHTFGWPIGVVMSKPEYRPRPVADGIVADILTTGPHESYDYWALRRNGDFYLLRDLFEDVRRTEQDTIFINTRIAQTTEAILYCARLYNQLRIDPSETVHVSVRHGGLKGRTLTWVDRFGLDSEDDSETVEDQSVTEFRVVLSELQSRLVELVKTICEPLFTLFNFYRVPDDFYEKSVESFVAGKVI
jgi:hypothetical protein